MRLFRLFLLFLFWQVAPGLRAVPADSLEVSLLTCEPGEEVYELYGHTALRCRDYSTGEDVVFNYGVFNFNTPHFVWHFTRGECDYEVRYVPFCYFYEEYAERGSFVVEQVLNLTTEEKLHLLAALLWNCQPENRKYRYNYLYDNCTTRVRDRIEEAVEGEVRYPDVPLKTYRTIIHEYTSPGHPWAQLGNDICLGAAVDTLIGVRAQMFAPFYLKAFADRAVIVEPGGESRPLVAETRYAVPLAERATAEEGVSPRPVFWSICVLLVVFTLFEIRSGRCFWPLDALLMAGQGIVGLVVTFLFFFSSHPSVDSNWQILILNPLPLVCLPRVVYCAIRRRFTRYHAVNLVWLTLFMLFSPFIPQEFSILIVPLAIILWTRSLRYILYYRKQCVQNR